MARFGEHRHLRIPGAATQRDALNGWLAALTTAECAAVGADATRETLTLSVA